MPKPLLDESFWFAAACDCVHSRPIPFQGPADIIVRGFARRERPMPLTANRNTRQRVALLRHDRQQLLIALSNVSVSRMATASFFLGQIDRVSTLRVVLRDLRAVGIRRALAATARPLSSVGAVSRQAGLVGVVSL